MTAIYDVLRAAVESGASVENLELGDENTTPGKLRWAAGALDGVMSHHAGHRRDDGSAEALGSADALAVLASTRPDVIVSDIGMPGQDGLELMRSVRRRSTDEGGDVPSLALTAYASAEDAKRALAAGFQRHAAKPITGRDLVAAVLDLAKSRTARSQRRNASRPPRRSPDAELPHADGAEPRARTS